MLWAWLAAAVAVAVAAVVVAPPHPFAPLTLTPQQAPSQDGLAMMGLPAKHKVKEELLTKTAPLDVMLLATPTEWMTRVWLAQAAAVAVVVAPQLLAPLTLTPQQAPS